MFNFDFKKSFFKINTMASASSSIQSFTTWDECAFLMCGLFDYLERNEGYPGLEPDAQAANAIAVAAPAQDANVLLYDIVMKIFMMMDNIHDFAKSGRDFQEEWTPYEKVLMDNITEANVCDVIREFSTVVDSAEIYKGYNSKFLKKPKCHPIGGCTEDEEATQLLDSPSSQDDNAPPSLKRVKTATSVSSVNSVSSSGSQNSSASNQKTIFESLVEHLKGRRWINKAVKNNHTRITRKDKVLNATYKLIYKSLLVFFKKIDPQPQDSGDIIGHLTNIIFKINMYEKRQHAIKKKTAQKQKPEPSTGKIVVKRDKIALADVEEHKQPPLCSSTQKLLGVLVVNLNNYIKTNIAGNTTYFNMIFREPYIRYFIHANQLQQFSTKLNELLGKLNQGAFHTSIFGKDWEKELVTTLSRWGRIKIVQFMKSVPKDTNTNARSNTYTASQFPINVEYDKEKKIQSWLAFYLKNLDWCNDTVGLNETKFSEEVLKAPYKFDDFLTKNHKIRTTLVTAYFDGCIGTTKGTFGLEVQIDRDRLIIPNFTFSVNFSDQSNSKVIYSYNPLRENNQLERKFLGDVPDKFGRGGTYVEILRDLKDLGTIQEKHEEEVVPDNNDQELKGQIDIEQQINIDNQEDDENEEDLPICDIGRECKNSDGTNCEWKRIDILSLDTTTSVRSQMKTVAQESRIKYYARSVSMINKENFNKDDIESLPSDIHHMEVMIDYDFKEEIANPVKTKVEDKLVLEKNDIRKKVYNSGYPNLLVNNYYDLTHRIKNTNQTNTDPVAAAVAAAIQQGSPLDTINEKNNDIHNKINLVMINEETRCDSQNFINDIGFFTTLKALGDFAQCKEAYARKCMFITQDSMQFLLGSGIGTMMLKDCAVVQHEKFLQNTRYWVSTSLFNKLFGYFYVHNSESVRKDGSNKIDWWFYNDINKEENIDKGYKNTACMKFLKMYKLKNSELKKELQSNVYNSGITSWFPLKRDIQGSYYFKIIIEAELTALYKVAEEKASSKVFSLEAYKIIRSSSPSSSQDSDIEIEEPTARDEKDKNRYIHNYATTFVNQNIIQAHEPAVITDDLLAEAPIIVVTDQIISIFNSINSCPSRLQKILSLLNTPTEDEKNQLEQVLVKIKQSQELNKISYESALKLSTHPNYGPNYAQFLNNLIAGYNSRQQLFATIIISLQNAELAYKKVLDNSKEIKEANEKIASLTSVKPNAKLSKKVALAQSALATAQSALATAQSALATALNSVLGTLQNLQQNLNQILPLANVLFNQRMSVLQVVPAAAAAAAAAPAPAPAPVPVNDDWTYSKIVMHNQNEINILKLLGIN
jgi:hypothetical protein